MLVQVINGVIQKIGLPTEGFLKDGSSVSGYNNLSEEILKNEGWLPLVENIPSYNSETQQLQHNGYTIEENQVVSNYIAVDIPQIPPPQPSQLDILQASYNTLLANTTEIYSQFLKSQGVEINV